MSDVAAPLVDEPTGPVNPWNQNAQQQKRSTFVIPWADEETRRVELANGQWVVLRRGDEVTEAGRRMYKIATLRAMDPKADSIERSTALAETDDYMLAMFVREWSFGDPIPQAQVARLHELPSRDYDLLVNCCGVLIPDAFPTFDPTPDVDSPFLGAGTAAMGPGGGEGRSAEAAHAALADLPARQAAAGVEQS